MSAAAGTAGPASPTAAAAAAGGRAAPLDPLTVVHSARSWLPRTQTWMYEQVRRLPPEHTPHVFCERTENLDLFPVAHLHAATHRWPAWRRQAERAIRAAGLRRHHALLAELVRALDADVLHSHFGHVGWLDAPALRGTRCRHVVTFYGADMSLLPRREPRWRRRYPELFATADRVLCEGPHMAARVAELGCPEHTVHVHRLGIDVDAIAYRPRTWDGIGPLRVLLCGTFTEKKGLVDGLDALAALRDELAIEVVLAGEAGPSPRNRAEKARILAAVERSGLPVERTGYAPHDAILRLAETCHVLLSPSVTAADGDSEGGAPVTILEMMASGMAIVATRHADIPDVLPEGTGLLVPERDVAALTAALRALIDDPASWRARQDAARAHVETCHHHATQAQALAGVYAALAGR